jgi:integrase
MPNMTVANQVNARIIAAIAMGTWRELHEELYQGTGPELTINQYIDRYIEVYCMVHNRASSVAKKRSTFKQMKKALGNIKLRDLQMRHVHEYIASRIKQERAAATVNRDISALKHLFEFAVDEGVLKVNPIARLKKLKECRAERPRFGEKTLQRVLVHLPFPVKQMVLFIFETGCRPSEAMNLKRGNVDIEKQTAIFNMRKAGDNALVALTTRAVSAIQQIPELPGCPYVFWNPHTSTHYERINETFHRARKRAGCPEVQLKDFRRELGIVIAESGQPLHVAQTQLGHSSIRTTEKYYAHFSPEFAITRARKVMEERWRNSGGQDPEPTPSEHPSKEGSSNLLVFNDLKR